MYIETRDFGKIEIAEAELIEFKEPILGFADDTKFALLQNNDLTEILWLQSIKNKDVCFLVIDPDASFKGYNPTFPVDIVNKLGLTKENTVVRTMLSVKNNFKDSTTNLKAPIVINKETRLAAQIVLEDDYQIKTPLFAKKEVK